MKKISNNILSKSILYINLPKSGKSNSGEDRYFYFLGRLYYLKTIFELKSNIC